uniref:Uncharacterized protein n=1 Tax=Arundo donax TaxID=35708 RepID=A0A0A9FRB4_ARUDO
MEPLRLVQIGIYQKIFISHILHKSQNISIFISHILHKSQNISNGVEIRWTST